MAWIGFNIFETLESFEKKLNIMLLFSKSFVNDIKILYMYIFIFKYKFIVYIHFN